MEMTVRCNACHVVSPLSVAPPAMLYVGVFVNGWGEIHRQIGRVHIAARVLSAHDEARLHVLLEGVPPPNGTRAFCNVRCLEKWLHRLEPGGIGDG